MTVRHRFAVLLQLGCGLALLASSVGFAGAPAPSPVASGPHPEHLVVNLGDFKLESGDVIKEFKVSYVTHGKLNKAKSNAVLIMHQFTADHHAMDYLIGPGKALDPEKYFIVATDFIGNSLIRQDVTTGPTNSGFKMDFPFYTILDSVNVEYRLLKEYLGLDHVLAVMGPSIGAMKAYQFAVSYPSYISGAIAIAGSPVTGPNTRWVLNNMMDIIALDADWHGGNYETNPTAGLTTAFGEFRPVDIYRTVFRAECADAGAAPRVPQVLARYFLAYAPQDARDIYYQLEDVGDVQPWRYVGLWRRCAGGAQIDQSARAADQHEGGPAISTSG